MTKVLLAGDSLAHGLTTPLKAEAQKYGIELRGDGRVGTTAAQWVRGGWLARDVADFQPTVTLISLGTNDAAGDLSTFGADVVTLAEQATSHGGALGWIAPPYLAPTLKQFPAGNIERMRATLQDVLSSRGIKVFASDAAAPAKDYARAPDHVHLTPAGYAQWAGDIADFAAFPAAVKQSSSPAVRGMSTRAKVGLVLGLVVIGGAIYAASD